MLPVQVTKNYKLITMIMLRAACAVDQRLQTDHGENLRAASAGYQRLQADHGDHVVCCLCR